MCIDRSSFPRIASNINSLVLLGMPPPILRTRLVSSDRISFSYRSGRSQFLISKLILNNTRPTRTDQNEGSCVAAHRMVCWINRSQFIPRRASPRSVRWIIPKKDPRHTFFPLSVTKFYHRLIMYVSRIEFFLTSDSKK